MSELKRITIDKDGIADGVKFVSSPHFNDRPDDINPDLIVIHNISLPPKEFGSFYVEEFFQGNIEKYIDKSDFFKEIKELRVSAHFFIDRNGEIIQFVSTEKRAWHAGVSEFEGRQNCNDFSIGIELNGCDDYPYTFRQYNSLSILIKALMLRYPQINIARITAHSEIAPMRKTDPGNAFLFSFLFKLLERS